MTHPYIRLLRDRDIGALWGGLTLSAIGSELYAVGAIWLAATIAGSDASYLASARFAAILAMSVAAGAFVDLVPRRVLLVGADLLRAAASLLVVAAAATFGLTLPVLILASVILSGFGALFQPALQSSLPRLVPDPGRLRETNGLFEATGRIAQTVGPFLAAALVALMPVIHLLTFNALSFLASAGVILRLKRRLERDDPPRPAPTLRARLARGVTAANGCPGAWRILVTTAVRAGGYALGFTVGVPLFFAEAGSAAGGVAAMAMVLGAAAAGELISNLMIVTRPPRDPWRFMFAGYALIGVALAALALAEAVLDGAPRVLVMTAAAIATGIGGSMAGIQMLTFFGSRLAPDDLAGVLRLRLVLVTGAAMVAAGLGPWLLDVAGTWRTGLGCGLLLAAIAAFAGLAGPRRRLIR